MEATSNGRDRERHCGSQLVSHRSQEPRLVAAEWINQTARQQQCVSRRLGNMRCKALNMNVIENENGVVAVSSSHVDGREPSVQSRLIATVPTKLVSQHLYCQQRLFSSVICPSKIEEASTIYKASDESRYISIKIGSQDTNATLKLGISPSWKITLQQNLNPKPESLILYCDGSRNQQLLRLPVLELMLSQKSCQHKLPNVN